MNWPKEDRLIFICARATLRQELKEQIKELLKAHLDWYYILDKAQKEGVSPLLYYNLSKMPGDGHNPPQDILDRLEKDYYRNVARNMGLYYKLEKILKALKRAGIEVILLKGAFLAETVYRQRALRPMGDIDLLIRKEDLREIHRILNSLGYFSPHNYQDYLNIPHSPYLNTLIYQTQSPIHFFLHLHWHLTNASRPLHAYTSKIDMDSIWNEAVSFNIGNTSAMTMSPHHMLIHLCEHAFRHSFDRLILLSDIFELIRYYDKHLLWNQVIKEANRFNLIRPLYYSLYFTHKFLGAKIPRGILSSIRPVNFTFWERKFISLILNNVRGPDLSFPMYLSIQSGLTQKIRFLWNTLFPPSQDMAHIYARNAHSTNAPHHIVRLHKAMGYGSRLLFSLITGRELKAM